MSEGSKPGFEVAEAEHFRMVYCTGVFGGLSPNDGRMILHADRLKTSVVEGKIGQEETVAVVREKQVEIRCSPATWKSIAKWMMNHVKQVEDQFGEIPEQPGERYR